MQGSQMDGGRKSPTPNFNSGTRFVCPKCSTWVLVHIPLEFRPSCNRHGGGETQMQEAANETNTR